MKKLYLIPVGLITLLLSFTSCKKEKEKTTTEKIEGQWMAGDAYLQNNLVASADGSYLTFNADGTGIDHKASDNSTGTFNWALQNEDKQILFTDTTSVGGFWNGAYTIVSITEKKLVIKIPSLLGEFKQELNK